MEKELLVTTEFLLKKEEEWKEKAAKAEQIFCQAADSVETLNQFFYGKPVLKVKADFLARKEKGKKDFEALLHHLEKLEVIAFVYDKVERENSGFNKSN
ncbi:MAG: hypothetical protein HDQ97_11885 [Lachnospiraceae bacterium]|nr:hypothetical protein [Lachnospiraceae bacterium]